MGTRGVPMYHSKGFASGCKGWTVGFRGITAAFFIAPSFTAGSGLFICCTTGGARKNLETNADYTSSSNCWRWKLCFFRWEMVGLVVLQNGITRKM
jgi:hypothetical protein